MINIRHEGTDVVQDHKISTSISCYYMKYKAKNAIEWFKNNENDHSFKTHNDENDITVIQKKRK